MKYFVIRQIKKMYEENEKYLSLEQEEEITKSKKEKLKNIYWFLISIIIVVLVFFITFLSIFFVFSLSEKDFGTDFDDFFKDEWNRRLGSFNII
jgi:uncharacterized membrane protein